METLLDENNRTRRRRRTGKDSNNKSSSSSINDHPDVVLEILKRLDDRSLGVAACVCRLWHSITRQDSFWETLCFRHASSSPATCSSHFKPVVVALGGYRTLYTVCMRLVLARLSRRLASSGGEAQQLQLHSLSLSLFSVYYYERLGIRLQHRDGSADANASLMFLHNPLLDFK